MKTYLLANSKSGGWDRVKTQLATLADATGIEIIHMDQGALEHSLPDSGRLVVAGGDGTLSRVVNAVAEKLDRFEFALLPTGTGNDLARSLDLYGAPIEDDWQRAISSPTTTIDVIRVTNGRSLYLLNAATGGFGGMVSTDVTTDDKRRWGAMAYWLTAFSKLTSLEESSIRLELDSETIELKTLGLGIANGCYVGGGFPVAPKAKLDDGLLDITTVPNLPTIELLAAGVDFMLGREHDPNLVRMFQSSRVRVIADPTMPYSLDGETMQGLDALFEVVSGALQIVAGENPVAL
ncbi:Diacylglycerol kinase [Novipirellula aureliae]|uniref:Diacylglycerol kinase n=1 Tax=Novipirellula aureliae TaxID=2527966 RepID=A0A5C6E3T7_9BACT|nr:YegS/Rv2252/BmrU family lipid kinase [Novipirellula aureliae]TWU43490.1 Diacylglycerol kinase [Novipirellula aureliae]